MSLDLFITAVLTLFLVRYVKHFNSDKGPLTAMYVASSLGLSPLLIIPELQNKSTSMYTCVETLKFTCPSWDFIVHTGIALYTLLWVECDTFHNVTFTTR